MKHTISIGVVVANFILIVLLILCGIVYNSHKDEPLRIVRNVGRIHRLSYTLDPPLKVDLQDLGSFDVVKVAIDATGREIAILTPNKQYYYYTELDIRTIYVLTKDIEIVKIPRHFAILVEQFEITSTIPEDLLLVLAPEKVNMRFLLN